MKRILSIFMIVLTVFLMVLPATAVDGEDADVTEWSDLLDEELFEIEETAEPSENVCYDTLINYMNNNETYVEEPMDDSEEETQRGLISPYTIFDPYEENVDKMLKLTCLDAEQLKDQDNGSHFKNLVYVDGEKNISYLHSLIREKYPNCCNIRIYSQGACSDGEYIYNALTIQYKYNEVTSKENCIVSGVYDDNGNFVTTAIRFTSDMVSTNCLVAKDALKHTNDITYNGLRDKLVIACAEEGYHNEVYILDADYFRGDTEVLPSVKKYELSCMITSIAYNQRLNKYVGLITESDMYFVYFDSDFNIVGTFNHSTDVETSNDPHVSSYVGKQGMCCDENYIYVAYFKKIDLNLDNMMVVYDWKGEKRAEFTFETTSVTWTDQTTNKTYFSDYEIEGISMLNDRIVLNFNVFWREENNDADKTTFPYLYDMSDLCFNIKYCPDDNVASYVDSNNLRNNTVIYGLSTKLLKNTYMNYGYKFVGWHLYSPKNGKWRYWKDVEYPGEDLYGWYVPGTQPEGYEKIVYKEDTSVKQTVPAGWNLFLCAVWEATDKFYISYDANDNGSGTITGEMDDQAMIYGQANDLHAGTFTKTVNGESVDFLGWNPYSPEVGKWYYESNSQPKQRGWYVEGEEPTGYTKVLYTNGGSVRQTTKPGGHITLFAVWDEFTIYYDAGGKLIKSEKEHIFLPTIVHKGIRTNLRKYSLDSIYSSETDIPNSFDGYHQYHIESERWRYQDDSDDSIWLTNSDLQLYTYKYDTIKNGLTAGQRVVFSAAWS